jgi:hypothetical protein
MLKQSGSLTRGDEMTAQDGVREMTAQDRVREILGCPGRLLSMSKSEYSRRHPTHTIVFNANLCARSHGKLWYGDIDVTADKKILKKVAEALGEKIYVLSEMDGRFENEEVPIYKNARAIISP